NFDLGPRGAGANQAFDPALILGSSFDRLHCVPNNIVEHLTYLVSINRSKNGGGRDNLNANAALGGSAPVRLRHLTAEFTQLDHVPLKADGPRKIEQPFDHGIEPRDLLQRNLAIAVQARIRGRAL